MSDIYVYQKDLIGLKINKKNFKWSFGVKKKCNTEKEFESCKFKIHIEIKKIKENIDFTDYKRFNDFYGMEETSEIIYHRNVLKIFKLRYNIKIKNNDVYIEMDSFYYNFIKYKIMNLHSLSYIAFDIMCMLLLKNNYSVIYGAAVELLDKTAILFAPSRTGKSLTSLLLHENNKGKIISEDLFISDGEFVYGLNYTNSFRKYRLKKEIEIKYITERRIPNRVFLLEKGRESVNDISINNFTKILTLQNVLVNYQKSPTNIAFSYFNQSYNLIDLHNREVSILKGLIMQNSIIRIVKENSYDFHKEIVDISNK